MLINQNSLCFFNNGENDEIEIEPSKLNKIVLEYKPDWF